MPWKSDKQRRWGHSAAGLKALGGKSAVSEWDMKSKKKHKISVNNKLKGALGQMDPKTNRIEINVKKHKGDRAELASTIKHEIMHVNHPKMTEKQVYKRTAKTKISPQEQSQLLAKLRHKILSYKVGAIKRKLKMKRDDKVEPGTLINKARNFKLGVAALI